MLTQTLDPLAIFLFLHIRATGGRDTHLIPDSFDFSLTAQLFREGERERELQRVNWKWPQGCIFHHIPGEFWDSDSLSLSLPGKRPRTFLLLLHLLLLLCLPFLLFPRNCSSYQGSREAQHSGRKKGFAYRPGEYIFSLRGAARIEDGPLFPSLPLEHFVQPEREGWRD